jgi:hypothetical protein
MTDGSGVIALDFEVVMVIQRMLTAWRFGSRLFNKVVGLDALESGSHQDMFATPANDNLH